MAESFDHNQAPSEEIALRVATRHGGFQIRLTGRLPRVRAVCGEPATLEKRARFQL